MVVDIPENLFSHCDESAENDSNRIVRSDECGR
ncbi:hypothetical protein HALLA_05355 [Halostagnicola larsenii XH-48]|uniref:Uncharacterized protein n=1 Tax=Halostagnicola larsenii XH-48 TaxID=797299 RepID=W0JTS2_9EURY|nr:hypothetical protein HALLA_05355 [Halostagnicola larsenii XH-48]